MICFSVMGAPHGKGRPRASTFGGGVRLYIDAKTSSYEAMVAGMAMVSMREQGTEPLEGPLDLRLAVWLGIPASWSKRKQEAALGALAPRKPDVDNCVKIIMDGLNGVAYRDDVQIARLSVERRYGKTPRVDVVLQVAEDMF